MEESRRSSEARYRTLAEASHDLIFIADRDDRIEYVNSFAAAVMKIPAEEAVGKERSVLYPGEQGRRQGAAVRRVFETGKEFHGEGPLEADSSLRWFDLLLIPVTGAEGTVTSVLGIARDITPAKSCRAGHAVQRGAVLAPVRAVFRCGCDPQGQEDPVPQ